MKGSLLGGEQRVEFALERVVADAVVQLFAGLHDVDHVALVAVAPGTPGQIYTVSDAGVPVWRTAATASSGPTATSGTYAARPGTCTEGSTYRVSSGARLGSVYRCALTDTWELERVRAPTSVVPVLYWDAERVADLGTGGAVITWRDESAAETLSLASNRTAAPTVGSVGYGTIAPVSWGANSGALRSLATGPTQALARTLVVVLSSVDVSADRAWAGWGGSGGSARTFALRTRTTSVTGLSFYGTDPWGTGAVPTTTTPTVISARYTGTQYALRQASLSGLSWSYSLALTTFGAGTYGLGAAAGTLAGIVVGAAAFDTSTYETTPARGDLHAVLIYAKALSEAEEEAVGTALAARFGP